MSATVTMTCPDCDGDGEIQCSVCDGDCYEKCPECEGAKWTGDLCPRCEEPIVECEECDSDGDISCRQCGGSGNVECSTCKGKGDVPDPEADPLAGALAGDPWAPPPPTFPGEEVSEEYTFPVSNGTARVPRNMTLHNSGLPLAWVESCPHEIAYNTHWRVNGTCRCHDSSHVEMIEWGYTWVEGVEGGSWNER